jgi:DNA-directed primase/polymerase protein
MYSVFSRQSQAFECADLVNSSTHDGRFVGVVSFETNASGCRKFVVCHRDTLWLRCLALPPRARHFYEIIREDTPAHLYFDLEFHKPSNPGVDIGRLIDLLLGFVMEDVKVRHTLPARHWAS